MSEIINHSGVIDEIGKYEKPFDKIELISRGHFGTVFKVIKYITHITYAIKVIKIQSKFKFHIYKNFIR